jgi:hypothetical protein
MYNTNSGTLKAFRRFFLGTQASDCAARETERFCHAEDNPGYGLDRHHRASHTGGHMEPNTRRLKHRQRGSEVVEFALILLPLLGFTFLIIDLGWAIFARATLQNAVREGVRYAVTSQTLDAKTGQMASIKSVVQSHSMGFLGDLNYVKVKFYRPDTFAELTGTGANDGGNLVEVSIETLPVSPLLPLLRSPAPLQMTARSSDRMEASPTTGAPPL